MPENLEILINWTSLSFKEGGQLTNNPSITTLPVESKQLERSLDGLKAKKKQHENSKKQNDINRNEVIKLWNSRHWNSFSQCAEHIYDNNLLPFKKGYRHIEALVSSVAKECKGTNSHPICTKWVVHCTNS